MSRKVIIVVRGKIKTIKNQSKVPENQVHDFVFQKVSPLIKKSSLCNEARAQARQKAEAAVL
jgi:hypothetical protein